jgi:hypothetical protein
MREIKFILECKPDYVQAQVAKVLCGIPKPTLMRLAAEGKVRSRRLDDDPLRMTDQTTRVYRYQDIIEWIENQAIDPNKL